MYEYRAFIENVVDGDTYDAVIVLEEHAADLGFNIQEHRKLVKKVRLRLAGFDTPETWRPKSEAERTHGEECTAFVKDLIEGKEVVVKTYKQGASIYGRYDADVHYVVGQNEDGTAKLQDLKVTLGENNFAKKDRYEEAVSVLAEEGQPAPEAEESVDEKSEVTY